MTVGFAVDRPDTRWCSDGLEIGCDNGERVRIAFTLDCCDRVMGHCRLYLTSPI
jgi:putative transposase